MFTENKNAQSLPRPQENTTTELCAHESKQEYTHTSPLEATVVN